MYSINLSILDFKEYDRNKHHHQHQTINLSILDFKEQKADCAHWVRFAINLSILDFKVLMKAIISMVRKL